MSDIQRGVQAFERLLKADEGVKTGTCKKCGGGGHLTFECRNLLKLEDKAAMPKKASRFGFIKSRLANTGSPSSQHSDKAADSPVSTPPPASGRAERSSLSPGLDLDRDPIPLFADAAIRGTVLHTSGKGVTVEAAVLPEVGDGTEAEAAAAAAGVEAGAEAQEGVVVEVLAKVGETTRARNKIGRVAERSVAGAGVEALVAAGLGDSGATVGEEAEAEAPVAVGNRDTKTGVVIESSKQFQEDASI
ncbi:hypothetical protein BGZ73_007404 [Actinomortierella ambigua]|nr:hypothetical protein BGZ73_007404 [Actinomortierella ambigua]